MYIWLARYTATHPAGRSLPGHADEELLLVEVLELCELLLDIPASELKEEDDSDREDKELLDKLEQLLELRLEELNIKPPGDDEDEELELEEEENSKLPIEDEEDDGLKLLELSDEQEVLELLLELLGDAGHSGWFTAFNMLTAHPSLSTTFRHIVLRTPASISSME